MKTCRRLVMLAIVATCVLAPSVAHAGDPFFTVRTVRIHAGDTYSVPTISGDWVIYCDLSVLGPAQLVKAENLRTGEVRFLHYQNKHQYYPDTQGTKIVWADSRGAGNNIYLYDLVSKKETTVTAGPLSPGRFPAVYGNRVVYDNNADVILYDMATKHKTDLGPGFEQRIYGDWVVWEGPFGPNSQIRAYNAATGQHVNVTNAPNGQPQVMPDIWGSIVVWSGSDGVKNRVWWKDLADSAPATAVAGTGLDPRNATISNNRIYFKDTVAGHTALWMHDLGGQAATPIQLSNDMTGSDRFEDARPYGDNVVYREGNGIFLCKVMAPTVSIARPSGSVPYKAAMSLAGSVRDFGIPVGNIVASDDQLRVQYSTNAWNWATVPWSFSTDGNGNYSIPTGPVATKTYFRVVYRGAWNPFTWYSHLSATSAVRAIVPRVALGKPSLPSKVTHGMSFTAWNYIQPKQTTGSKPVKIQYWRLSSGHYQLKKTVMATISYYSPSKSKYAAAAKLPSKGKWRIRAVYPTSATNAYTATGWTYRTVR